MATTSAALSTSSFTTVSISGTRRSLERRSVPQINSFVGLKAHNGVHALTAPVSNQYAFSKVVKNSIRAVASAKGRSVGGGMSARCNAAAEIFNIVLIIQGLVLAGVAVGFVLLRIESFVEEAE